MRFPLPGKTSKEVKFYMAVDLIDNNAFVQQIIDKGKAEANLRNTGELGKQDFLNLLILQLRYQDPLNPVDDKEFIAQMAQFSALEQMQAMNAGNTAMKGFSMIGKYVSAMISDDASGRPLVVEGHVESVVMNGSRTFVVVSGREVPIDSVYNVADGFNPLNSTLSAYTGLMGYFVKGAVFDLATGEIVGVSGEVVSLVKGAYEDYAMLNGVNAAIAGINKNGNIIEDRAKIREYLENIDGLTKPEDRQVELFIMDENGKRVPVGATLRSYVYDADFGMFKAVLDGVAVPVASVAAIKKASGGTAAIPEPDEAKNDGSAPDAEEDRDYLQEGDGEITPDGPVEDDPAAGNLNDEEPPDGELPGG
jgi:flagellar basal-body rod modification protein FlgD